MRMIRLAFPILAAAALAAPALAQDGLPSARPDALDPAAEIQARELLTRMSVPVTVNGAGPFRFVVDSGADRSVVGRQLASRLNLPASSRVILHGTVGSSPVETVKVASLKVGSGTLADLRAPALHEQHIGAQGLLGVDALADQRVTLDFERERMTIQGSGRPPALDPDEIVVTARRRFGQLILAQASVEKDKVYAIVDTGSQVTLGNTALREKVFRSRNRPRSYPITLIGVTGQEMVAEMMYLPRIRIGGVTMTNVPVAFSDAPPFRLFGVEKQPAMLLGTDLLRSFRRVMLDFRTKKVRFLLRGREEAEIG